MSREACVCLFIETGSQVPTQNKSFVTPQHCVCKKWPRNVICYLAEMGSGGKGLTMQLASTEQGDLIDFQKTHRASGEKLPSGLLLESQHLTIDAALCTLLKAMCPSAHLSPDFRRCLSTG